MKFKLVLLILLTLATIGASDAMGQWVTNGPFGGNVNAFAAMGMNTFAGIDGGVFRSTDSGATWTVASTGITSDGEQLIVYSLAVMGTNLFESSGEGVFRSSDSGRSWARIALTETNITSLSVDGTNLYAASGVGYTFGSFFRSTDSGASWKADSVGQLGNEVWNITAIGNTIFAGTWYGLFWSTDSGISWTTTQQETVYSPSIHSFAQCSGNLFVGIQGGGVVRSTDSGITWTPTGSGLYEYAEVNALAVNGSNLFAGTSTGIFLSTNNGANWTDVSDNITGLYIYSMIVNDGYLFVGTDTGVWRRPVSEMIGSSSVAEAPQQANTITVYPNPVSHEATIGFSTNTPSQTSVTIFDVLGNAVDALFSGTLEVGNHSLTWDASSVSPGAYYARIASDNGDVQTVKVVKE